MPAALRLHNRIYKTAAGVAIACALAAAADTIEVFGDRWTVPNRADWRITNENGTEILSLIQGREPAPGPRRPSQFAIADTPLWAHVVMEADLRPLGRSLMIVFAYRDAAHFDYAHLSTDTASKQPVHNGIFHVYGGERVRISREDGPAAFAEAGRWYHVRLDYDSVTGRVKVDVDGQAVPALDAVDVSLGRGHAGIGSFDETGEFKNVRISGSAAALRD